MLAGWVSRLRTMSLAGCVAHTGGAVVQHQRTARGQLDVHRPGRGLTDHQNTTGIHDRLPKVAQIPFSWPALSTPSPLNTWPSHPTRTLAPPPLLIQPTSDKNG